MKTPSRLSTNTQLVAARLSQYAFLGSLGASPALEHPDSYGHFLRTWEIDPSETLSCT